MWNLSQPSLQCEVLKSELARGRQAIPAVESPRFERVTCRVLLMKSPKKAVDEVLHRQARRFFNFSCYISQTSKGETYIYIYILVYTYTYVNTES